MSETDVKSREKLIRKIDGLLAMIDSIPSLKLIDINVSEINTGNGLIISFK